MLLSTPKIVTKASLFADKISLYFIASGISLLKTFGFPFTEGLSFL